MLGRIFSGNGLFQKSLSTFTAEITRDGFSFVNSDSDSACSDQIYVRRQDVSLDATYVSLLLNGFIRRFCVGSLCSVPNTQEVSSSGAQNVSIMKRRLLNGLCERLENQTTVLSGTT